MNITFETAKLAYNKGYRGKAYFSYYLQNNEKLCMESNLPTMITPIGQFAAPTQSELQTWLRNEHKIYCEVSMYVIQSGEYDGCLAFKAIIKDTENYKEKIVYEKDCFLNYEKALEDSLVEGLKRVVILSESDLTELEYKLAEKEIQELEL